MDPIFTQQFNMPAPQAAPSGGMFGAPVPAWKSALAAGLAGFVSRRNPDLAQSMMAPMMMRQKAQMELASYQAQKNIDMKQQLQMLPLEAQLRMQYPEPDDYMKMLIANGIHPGTPEWAQHMQTHLTNTDDPVVTTPQGMMLRSQVTGAVSAKPLTDADIAAMDGKGGQTPPASGGFLGAGSYPDIGPYHRY